MLWLLLFIVGIALCSHAFPRYAAHGDMVHLFLAGFGIHCLFKGFVRTLFSLRRPSR